MTLLEMMLNDQRIVLALAAALMPLALAALLGVAFQVRRLVRRRAEQRAAEEARALAAYARADDLDGQDGKPLDDEIVSPDAAGAVDELFDIAEGDTASEEVGDGAASSMQSVLDSVFTDEEAPNPLAHLLDELDDIQADDLAALCESVAERLA